MKNRIGVFDTGIGGEIVTDRLKIIFPDVNFMIVNDRENLPYGSKTKSEIIYLTELAIQPLVDSCRIIIIACNTATAEAISAIRHKYPNVDFIGFEPALKPASLKAKINKVIVLATPATLRSEKYQGLKLRYAEGIEVMEPNCSDWAEKIENGNFGKDDLEPIINYVEYHKVDSIVLGCTHYLAIEDDLRLALPSVSIETQIAGVAKRLKEIMLKY